MSLNFSTLILPDTIPQEDSIRQLLLYFETIFLYSPSEDIPVRLPAEFSRLYRHYAPVPFGDTLPNFQQLVRDMTKNRAEFYGGGLSALSTRTNAVDEESVWRLVSRLSPQPTSNIQHETLLQARLLLKLAEVREQEENEIERTLTDIANQSRVMLQGLTDETGDEEEKDAISVLAYPDQQQSDNTLGKRLRAWAHLFVADERRADHWLVSTTPEMLASLIDFASTEMNESPNRLLSLPLPGASIIGLSPADYLLERRAWRQEASVSLAALALGLKGAVASGIFETSATIHTQLAACQRKMPAWGGKPQAHLELYLLPVPLGWLFAKIAKVPVHASEASALTHGLVAVIQPAPPCPDS